MNLRYARINLLVALLLIGFSFSSTVSNLSGNRQIVTLTGHLSIVWRDEKTAIGFRSDPIYILSDENGHSTRLVISETLAHSISIESMSGTRMIVEGEETQPSSAGLQRASLYVTSVRFASAATLAPASRRNQILCFRLIGLIKTNQSFNFFF